MRNGVIKDRYFEWMYNLVGGDNRYKRTSYRKLFKYLHNIPFTYTIAMDGNRAADGVDVRYRFGECNRISDVIIANTLDTDPCSVLEMMIGLAIRCEEQIMENSEIGNRTSKWFWDMIVSLGLEEMSDDAFDLRYVESVINRFLNRKYQRNGKGGLFTVNHTSRDMRNVEIWYQMSFYLDQFFR